MSLTPYKNYNCCDNTLDYLTSLYTEAKPDLDDRAQEAIKEIGNLDPTDKPLLIQRVQDEYFSVPKLKKRIIRGLAYRFAVRDLYPNLRNYNDAELFAALQSIGEECAELSPEEAKQFRDSLYSLLTEVKKTAKFYIDELRTRHIVTPLRESPVNPVETNSNESHVLTNTPTHIALPLEIVVYILFLANCNKRHISNAVDEELLHKKIRYINKEGEYSNTINRGLDDQGFKSIDQIYYYYRCKNLSKLKHVSILNIKSIGPQIIDRNMLILPIKLGTTVNSVKQFICALKDLKTFHCIDEKEPSKRIPNLCYSTLYGYLFKHELEEFFNNNPKIEQLTFSERLFKRAEFYHPFCKNEELKSLRIKNGIEGVRLQNLPKNLKKLELTVRLFINDSVFNEFSKLNKLNVYCHKLQKENITRIIESLEKLPIEKLKLRQIPINSLMTTIENLRPLSKLKKLSIGLIPVEHRTNPLSVRELIPVTYDPNQDQHNPDLEALSSLEELTLQVEKVDGFWEIRLVDENLKDPSTLNSLAKTLEMILNRTNECLFLKTIRLVDFPSSIENSEEIREICKNLIKNNPDLTIFLNSTQIKI